ncbi:hypothetical protein AB1Y20_003738 [Prymnesium parvum]|uniref:Amino acid transporter transmembrane domain-containing protein n=1 Tax=Prymnesium parvum TaxID=97485 RepID=A0AB34J628_PRYPA
MRSTARSSRLAFALSVLLHFMVVPSSALRARTGWRSTLTTAHLRVRCTVRMALATDGRLPTPEQPAVMATPPTAQHSEPPMLLSDASAMIAGTAIGGGILALPIVTTPMGFLPALVALTCVWGFLLLTAIAYAEAGSSVLRQIHSESSGGRSTVFGVVSLTRRAFGGKISGACSVAFLTQMLAVVTAQVVKAGEMLALKLPLSPFLACAIPSAAAGIFAFSAPHRTVERANTWLSLALLVGFAALVAAAVGSGPVSSSLMTAKWGMLLPAKGVGSTWAVPVFLNMLCFGQAVPLVVSGMLPATSNEHKARSADNVVQTTQLRAVRSALLIGSVVPLVLSLVWAASSTALTSVLTKDSTSVLDPVMSLLEAPLRFSLPVSLLALGAIGTTLLASFLALGQFIDDALTNVKGQFTRRERNIASAIVVIVPSVLASAGPRLYMPLLAFSGAFPTTILYCLMPPLAAMVFHRRARDDSLELSNTALLPGGDLVRAALAVIAVGLVGTSAVDFASRMLPRVFA